jgi:hypothetical protein
MCTADSSTDQGIPVGEWAAGPTLSWLCQNGEFRWYRIYGIRLRSQIQLSFPESEPVPSPDISLLTASPGFFKEATRHADVRVGPSGWYKYAQLDDGQSYLRWDGLFEFLVDSDGRRIWCGWLGATSLESLQVYLLGHALSFALVKQGFEPLHATSVVIDGHAIAFLGSSGFGKSSLAAAFLGAGHRLLTDDLLLLRQDQSGYVAHPGPPRIKLFPKVARHFLAGTAPGVPMNGATEKLVLPLADHQCHNASVPLRAIYVLAAPREVYRKQRIRVTPLSPRETFIELVRNTFNYLVTDAERLRRQHGESAQVAIRVPARRISHPRVLSLLPALSDAVLADLAEVIASGHEKRSSPLQDGSPISSVV